MVKLNKKTWHPAGGAFVRSAKKSMDGSFQNDKVGP